MFGFYDVVQLQLVSRRRLRHLFSSTFLRASRTDGSYRMDQTGNPDRAHRWFQSPHPSGQPTHSSAQTSSTTQVCRQQEKSETHISDNSCLCMSAKLILSRPGAQTTASFCPPLFSLLAHAASFEPDVRLRGRDLEVNDVPAELAYSDGACIDPANHRQKKHVCASLHRQREATW